LSTENFKNTTFSLKYFLEHGFLEVPILFLLHFETKKNRVPPAGHWRETSKFEAKNNFLTS
jgi:hypothetical protein